jgi:uncharacterized protein (TIGR02145 family)
MSTIQQNLERLSLTKQQIRAAIIAKGVAVPENTPFKDYPDKIMQITGGGGGGGDTDYIEIAGIKWAKSSLIADPADSTGMTSMFADRQDVYTGYFQWGRKKVWAATGSTVTGWPFSTDHAIKWEGVADPSPAGWRIPTVDELQALVDAGSTWRAANSSAGNAVAGRFFGANSAEATMADVKGCIFLTAGGNRSGTTGTIAGNQGVSGWYWAASAVNTINKDYMVIRDSGASVSNADGDYGFNLRCVKE